jgi:hypothetical protein
MLTNPASTVLHGLLVLHRAWPACTRLGPRPTATTAFFLCRLPTAEHWSGSWRQEQGGGGRSDSGVYQWRLGQHGKVGNSIEVHQGGDAHRSGALDGGGGSAEGLTGARP